MTTFKSDRGNYFPVEIDVFIVYSVFIMSL